MRPRSRSIRGLPLPSGYSGNHGKKASSGRLYFQTRPLGGASLPEILPGHGADNAILAQTLQLQREAPAARVTLVSKDINLRIKGAVLGVHVEDYNSDKTLEDSDVLYSGMAGLPADFWEQHGKDMRSWKEADRTFYEVARSRRPRLVAQPRRLRGRGTWHRGHRAQGRRRHGDPGADPRLSQRTSQHLGGYGAQPRAEFRLEPADGPGYRSGHTARSGPALARRCWRSPPDWPRPSRRTGSWRSS